eukprot:6187669-Pleurochrysis_carterae.AAC.1
MRGTISKGDDAINYHGLAQKDSFAAYHPMRRPNETLTEYLSEALRGWKIVHSLHDDGLIRNATHNDLPRTATILLQQFHFDSDYADAQLAYSHLRKNVEAFKGKEKPGITTDSVVAFCVDVSKVDDILELVRVLTVAARKSKATDRKRSRSYREFN